MTRKGFSLAEILITLGVIGIVAALTIPQIVKKYNEVVTVNSLRKTFSEMQQVIKMSEVEHGSFRYWDYELESDAFAKKYIMPYLTKDFKYIGYMKFTYRTPAGQLVQPFTLAQYYYNHKKIGIIVRNNNTDNGSIVKYVNFIIDLNGDNGQDMMGKDVFVFTLFNYAYYYGDWNETALCPKGKHYGFYLGDIGGYWGAYCATSVDEILGSGARGNCNIAGSGTNCGLAIEKSGCKIPKGYPIKF